MISITIGMDELVAVFREQERRFRESHKSSVIVLDPWVYEEAGEERANRFLEVLADLRVEKARHAGEIDRE